MWHGRRDAAQFLVINDKQVVQRLFVLTVNLSSVIQGSGLLRRPLGSMLRELIAGVTFFLLDLRTA